MLFKADCEKANVRVEVIDMWLTWPVMSAL